jgi:hypothetical protein
LSILPQLLTGPRLIELGVVPGDYVGGYELNEETGEWVEG